MQLSVNGYARVWDREPRQKGHYATFGCFSPSSMGSGLVQRCPTTLQELVDKLVALFERVGLHTNTAKTKAMVCIPGKIRTRLLEEVYTRSYEGLGGRRNWRSEKVACNHCGVRVTAGALEGHLRTQHNIFHSLVLNRDLILDREPETYTADPPSAYRGVWECPYPDCVGTATTRWSLRRHFIDRHPNDLVNVPGEGVLPQCERYGI